MTHSAPCPPRGRGGLQSEPSGPRSDFHYAPVDTVTHPECVAPPTADRCQCGRCEKTLAHIVNDEPQFFEQEQCTATVRTVYCDHCNHLIHWIEQVNDRGLPTGFVLSQPGYDRSRRNVERFLKRHGKAVGVLQR